ncbi:TetR/AcrR family transcriptional regulator [Neobacillus niacini]|uniref:TetR/AcrR family transcriptional regulator n=1 Tax=Neobacillus niacini TaxID=86668 RepID=UPI003B01D31A
MGKKQDDRRVIRTKHMLKETLLTLLVDKNYSDITVNDICDLAQYSRVTFYAHYEDKKTLLNEMIQDKINGLFESIYKSDTNGKSLVKVTVDSWIINLFQFINENADFFQLVYARKIVPTAFENLYRGIWKFLNEEITITYNIPLKTRLNQEAYIHYLSSAVFSVIHYWIREGFAYSPKYMAKQLHEIFKRPIENLFQPNHYEVEVERKFVKLDPRIRRTKKSFKQSLISLLSVSPYHEITIKQITETALCNRVTFYSHYQNKEHLLKEIIDEKNSGLIDALHRSYLSTALSHKIENHQLPLFYYLKEHSNLYKLMSSQNKNSCLSKDIYEKIYQYHQKQLQLSHSMEKEMNQDAFNHFITGGLIGVITYWTSEQGAMVNSNRLKQVREDF